jgi:hypothetical protein
MGSSKRGTIHALEFSCQAPLKFYERCSACARFGDDCDDLQLGKDILRGRKKIVYAKDGSADGVHANSFKCLAPLYYFEKSRTSCAHEGRCREEGLLLALLNGKKQLVYSQKAAVELPVRKMRRKKAAAKAKSIEQQA